MDFLPKEETGFRIPSFILRRPVSMTAKLLYGLLLSNSSSNGTNAEYRSFMAEQLGCKPSNIDDAMNELERESLIHATTDKEIYSYSMLKPKEFYKEELNNFCEKDIEYLQRIKHTLMANLERRKRRRVQMVLCREKITTLIRTGVTLAAMHRTLQEAGDFIGGYAQFLIGVRKDLPDLYERYFATSPRGYIRRKKGL